MNDDTRKLKQIKQIYSGISADNAFKKLDVVKEYNKFKVGEVVEMGKYDFGLRKIVFDKKLTIKKIYTNDNLLSSDLLEFKEIPGRFNKNRFYKKGTLEKIK